MRLKLDQQELKITKRARRASLSVVGGDKIFARLRAPDARALLIEGAEARIPPVAKIGPLLLTDPGLNTEEVKLAPAKALIGLCVRAILAEEGYERIERGVRTGMANGLFVTGSVYAKVGSDPDAIDEDESDTAHLFADLAARALTKRGRKYLIGLFQMMDS